MFTYGRGQNPPETALAHKAIIVNPSYNKRKPRQQVYYDNIGFFRLICRENLPQVCILVHEISYDLVRCTIEKYAAAQRAG